MTEPNMEVYESDEEEDAMVRVLQRLSLNSTDEMKDELLEHPDVIFHRDKNDRMLIHWAALNNNKQLMQILLCRDRDMVSVKDDQHKTPLMLVVQGGYLEIALLLLSYGANVRDRCRRGRDALSYACSSEASSLDMMQLLLQHGADPKVADRFGDTPLHQLATRDCEELLLCLINAGVDLNAQNIIGDTALHVACQAKQQRTAELLLDHGAIPTLMNRMKELPFNIANMPMRRMLLHKWNNPSVTALISTGGGSGLRMDAAESVIECGEITEPNVESAAPEVYEGDKEEDSTARILQRLSLNSTDEMKDELLEHPDVIFHRDKNGRLLIHWAAMNNNSLLVHILLCRDRAMVTAQDDQHMTPLLLAVQGGHQDMVRILMSYEAHIGDRCRHGRGVLWYACSRGENCTLDMVQLLLEYGADPKSSDKMHSTALHRIAFYNRRDIVACLLRAGVDPNARDLEGDTALHIACMAQQRGIANLLCKRGALVTIRNGGGATPFNLTNSRIRRGLARTHNKIRKRMRK